MNIQERRDIERNKQRKCNKCGNISVFHWWDNITNCEIGVTCMMCKPKERESILIKYWPPIAEQALNNPKQK